MMIAHMTTEMFLKGNKYYSWELLTQFLICSFLGDFFFIALSVFRPYCNDDI